MNPEILKADIRNVCRWHSAARFWFETAGVIFLVIIAYLVVVWSLHDLFRVQFLPTTGTILWWIFASMCLAMALALYVGSVFVERKQQAFKSSALPGIKQIRYAWLGADKVKFTVLDPEPEREFAMSPLSGFVSALQSGGIDVVFTGSKENADS